MDAYSTTIAVHVVPRASKNEVSGRHGDAIKIKLTAPAVEGAANEALLEYLAKKLGIAKRRIKIVAGERSRDKMVRVEAAEAHVVDCLLAPREEHRLIAERDSSPGPQKTNKAEE